MTLRTPLQTLVDRAAGERNIRVAWWIFGVALGLRLSMVLLVHNAQYSDSVWYDAAAARLAAVGEYGPTGPSAWFPPGYPFFLAAIYKVFGHVQLAGKLANALIGAGTCVLAYVMGQSFFGNRQAMIAAVLVALWPNLIFHTLILDTETLTTLFFVLALWIGTRESVSPSSGWRRMLILGVILGWAMLTRPAAAILVPTIALYWWLRWRSLRRVARLLVLPVSLAAVMIVGWTVRNRIRFGEWIPVATNGGYNFWQANNRYANGNDTFWSAVPAGDLEYETMRNGDEFARNREGYRYGKKFLRAHPFYPLMTAPTKFKGLYHTDTSGLYEGILYAPELSPSFVAAWMLAHMQFVESTTYRYYFIVVLLAVVAAVVASRLARPTVLSLLALPILLLSFHLFFHAKDRFHVPLNPIFALLAAVTINRMIDAVRLTYRAKRVVPRAGVTSIA